MFSEGSLCKASRGDFIKTASHRCDGRIWPNPEDCPCWNVGIFGVFGCLRQMPRYPTATGTARDEAEAARAKLNAIPKVTFSPEPQTPASLSAGACDRKSCLSAAKRDCPLQVQAVLPRPFGQLSRGNRLVEELGRPISRTARKSPVGLSYQRSRLGSRKHCGPIHNRNGSESA